jgi:tetratricopeptide (TPR) repeat protein
MGFNIMNKTLTFLCTLFIITLFCTATLEAAGERSSLGRRRPSGAAPTETPASPVTPVQTPPSTSPAATLPPIVSVPSWTKEPTPSAAITTNVVIVLSDDELADMERSYKEKLGQKLYADALAILNKIPDKQLDKKKKTEKVTLQLFGQVEEESAKNNNALFQKEDELDEDTQKTIQKLYREAQYAIFNGNNDLARDLLIQILYLHRPNIKAKKMMLLGLNLKSEDYKVEDIKQKYWNKSKTLFYGGNYQASAEALNVLVFFDKENPLIYERLGSSYYMMGEKRKAIESWNTALFFNPGNKDLEATVERAKKAMAEEEAEARNQPNVVKKNTPVLKAGETQLMGLFKTQTEAYNFASELKKKNLTPVVEEQDNGRWAVKVPKNQLQK